MSSPGELHLKRGGISLALTEASYARKHMPRILMFCDFISSVITCAASLQQSKDSHFNSRHVKPLQCLLLQKLDTARGIL